MRLTYRTRNTIFIIVNFWNYSVGPLFFLVEPDDSCSTSLEQGTGRQQVPQPGGKKKESPPGPADRRPQLSMAEVKGGLRPEGRDVYHERALLRNRRHQFGQRPGGF